jgi:ribonuclease HI
MSMKIYTDSSYDNNKKVGGWGVVVCIGEKRRTISNWGRFSSNNEAELFAIYEACILSGGSPAEIFTDSQTALQYIQNGVAEKPRTQEQYIRHKHCEFWAYKIRKFKNCTFSKVKAHTKIHKRNNVGNCMADLMARDGLSKFYEKSHSR